MKQTIKINTCFHSCPLFSTSMEGMYCGHPYFEDRPPYDSCIINHDNSKGRVPDGCPLYADPLTTVIKLGS